MESVKEISQKIVNDLTSRFVSMKPMYDSVDLGVALINNHFKDLQQNLAELQQQSAMQQLEIMRLREALEEIERYGDCKVCYAESTKALYTPATYDYSTLRKDK